MPFLQLGNQPGHCLGRAVDVAKETDFCTTSRFGQCDRDFQLRGIQADIDLAILLHGSSSLCVRLGAGPSSAILARRILRDEPPLENEHTVCQVAVSLSVANDHVSLPIAYQLFLPQIWADDPARRAKAGVPDTINFETKTAIARGQLRQALAAGVPVGILLGEVGQGSAGAAGGIARRGDAAYGDETAFRVGVAELGLRYVLGVRSTTSVWPPGKAPLPPLPWSGRGRRPTRLRRDAEHQ